MKSLARLTEYVLQDRGTWCGANPARDIKTVYDRTEKEGESFLTITLPAYGAALDRAITNGKLERSMTPSFRWHRRGLPEFLRGFLLQIFGTDGNLLPNPSVDCIHAVRLICYLQKKILRECTDKRKRKAIEGYKECENEIEGPNAHNNNDSARRAYRFVAGVIWSDLLRGFPNGDPYEEIKPKHGPGATVERVLGNSKYLFRKWYQRLESVFPFTEFGVGSLSNIGTEKCPLAAVDFVEPKDEEPVRVTLVPKTLKTPRVIAIEPVCMQYMQQGLLNVLVPLIERGRYTGGRVNFSDQTINQRIALSSSRTGRYATLDMKEASDRVSLQHVTDMLETCPALLEKVLACRSTRAVLPDGDIVTLKKFASMGSALCFPMEAMVFFCIIVSSRLLQARLPLTSRNVYRMSRDVFVYGDDIIVPTDEAPSVCDHLEAFALRVNRDKSFWTGKFRESCGVDAYDGVDVTPVYVRHEQPSDRRHASELASWVSLANQFYKKGMWHAASKVRTEIESRFGKLPTMSESSPGLCWVSYSGMTEHTRWNRDLMRFETRTLVLNPVRRKDPLGDDSALLKVFLNAASTYVETAKDHLEQSVARGKLALRSRWVPAL